MKRLVLAALLASLVGCGGEDDKPASGITKAEFLVQAEAVCAKANADEHALTRPTAVDALAPYVTKVVAIADTATKGLHALELPKADRADLEKKVLTPLDTQLAKGHTFAAKVEVAAQKKDQQALIGLLSDPPTDTTADLRWMKSYGFDECVKAADTSS